MYNLDYFEEDEHDTIRVVLLIIMFVSFVISLILFAVGYTQELAVVKYVSFAFLGSGGLCFMILVSLCDEW